MSVLKHNQTNPSPFTLHRLFAATSHPLPHSCDSSLPTTNYYHPLPPPLVPLNQTLVFGNDRDQEETTSLATLLYRTSDPRTARDYYYYHHHLPSNRDESAHARSGPIQPNSHTHPHNIIATLERPQPQTSTPFSSFCSSLGTPRDSSSAHQPVERARINILLLSNLSKGPPKLEGICHIRTFPRLHCLAPFDLNNP